MKFSMGWVFPIAIIPIMYYKREYSTSFDYCVAGMGIVLCIAYFYAEHYINELERKQNCESRKRTKTC